MVTIAFIDATDADYISAGSRNIVFLAEDSESKHTFISKNDYYSYNAVVDGEIKEVLVQSTLDKLYDPANALLVPGDTGAMVNENMVFVSPQYDDGVITELTQVNSAAPFSADVNYDTVTGTEMFHKTLEFAEAGDNVGLLLRGIKREDIERGQVLCKPGSVTPHTKFTGEIYVLTKEEGGRHTPFFDGYRPQFYFRTTDVTGTVKLPEGTEMAMPGDHITIEGDLIHPIAMEEGLRFAIREGGHTVGSGIVSTIIE